jgi:predicted lipoprotein
MNISKAITSLRPSAEWVLRGDTYDGLEWLDTQQTKPTESEINAEIARLQAVYQANEYQRNRAAEYPSFADQFDTLYHGGYDAWKAQIDAIKLKYPKP